MLLTEQEELLIKAVRALSPEGVQQVLNWARQVTDLAQARSVQWSDSWTEEDLADATAASLRCFEEREQQTN